MRIYISPPHAEATELSADGNTYKVINGVADVTGIEPVTLAMIKQHMGWTNAVGPQDAPPDKPDDAAGDADTLLGRLNTLTAMPDEALIDLIATFGAMAPPGGTHDVLVQVALELELEAARKALEGTNPAADPANRTGREATDFDNTTQAPAAPAPASRRRSSSTFSQGD